MNDAELIEQILKAFSQPSQLLRLAEQIQDPKRWNRVFLAAWRQSNSHHQELL